jgi:hypothetical protein
MNLENLHEGLVIKNYKEMCNLLDEEVEAGNSKEAQLKKWRRYFDFEKLKNKFEITKIYEKPKVITADSLKRQIYIKCIEMILMYELSTKTSYKCNYTKNQLFELLGMVNRNYARKHQGIVQKSLPDIKPWEIKHFYLHSNQRLSKILFSALNSLRSRCLLEYKEQKIIVQGSIHRTATAKEISDIVEIENIVLHEMGYDKKPYWKINEFYNKVNERLNEMYGWDYTFNEYLLIFTAAHMIKDLPIVQREIKELLMNNKSSLNQKIIDALQNQIAQNFKRNLEKSTIAWEEFLMCDEADPDFESKQCSNRLCHYPDTYEENQIRLIDFMIEIE